MTKSSQKSVKIVYLFWNLHTLKCKENIYLEYMNINHEPVATRLVIDIKHRPDMFWLTFDITHQPNTVLVDI